MHGERWSLLLLESEGTPNTGPGVPSDGTKCRIRKSTPIQTDPRGPERNSGVSHPAQRNVPRRFASRPPRPTGSGPQRWTRHAVHPMVQEVSPLDVAGMLNGKCSRLQSFQNKAMRRRSSINHFHSMGTEGALYHGSGAAAEWLWTGEGLASFSSGEVNGGSAPGRRFTIGIIHNGSKELKIVEALFSSKFGTPRTGGGLEKTILGTNYGTP